MYREFEVRVESVLLATPRQVWDALIILGPDWVQDSQRDLRAGRGACGLTSSNGTVTAWEPERQLATNEWRCDGWRNDLRYELEPRGAATVLRHTQTGVLPEDEYDAQYEGCVRHAEQRHQILGEYLEDVVAGGG